MVSRSRVWKEASEKSEAGEDGGGDKRGDYEETRLQRIKENMERMKSLGIAELSKQLKPPPPPPLIRRFKPAPSSLDPPRRSPRLEGMPAVVYKEIKPVKKEDSLKKDKIRRVKKEHSSMKLRNHISEGESSESSSDDEDSADEDSEDEDENVMDNSEIEIHIPEGKNPEIYTDEHEKLLGDSVAAWDLFVDGFDEDGNRVYDDIQSKNCHQCRLKTVGLVTKCRKCNKATGQLCGDCLYMRYGENVKEVNLNRDWVCPVCRGICNCIRCRRDKGWNPTGEIYSKVEKLGFKSVAHYLIRTRQEGATVGLGTTKSPSTGEESCTVDDEKEGSSDELSQSGTKEHKITEDTMEPDCDGECEGDDHDDKNGNIDSDVEME